MTATAATAATAAAAIKKNKRKPERKPERQQRGGTGTPRTLRTFANVADFAGLIAANVRFLRGELPEAPYHLAPLLAESTELVADLIACNEAGCITVESQPGLNEPGLAQQRSYLAAYIPRAVWNRILAGVARAGAGAAVYYRVYDIRQDLAISTFPTHIDAFQGRSGRSPIVVYGLRPRTPAARPRTLEIPGIGAAFARMRAANDYAAEGELLRLLYAGAYPVTREFFRTAEAPAGFWSEYTVVPFYTTDMSDPFSNFRTYPKIQEVLRDPELDILKVHMAYSEYDPAFSMPRFVAEILRSQ